jgi:ornithine cyclodeaminase/alanine dehydrogenase-like protein (mu-crystallin family)
MPQADSSEPHSHARLLYLTRAEVMRASQRLDCVGLIRETLVLHATGKTVLPEEAYLAWSHGEQRLRTLGMPAYVGPPFDAAGIKIINSNPSNIDRGVPRADGLVVLNDIRSGAVSCVMDGSYLSALRTACVTTVASEALALAATRLAIIGCGAIAEAHIRTLPKHIKTLRRLLLFDIRHDRAKALKSRIEAASIGDLDISIEPSAESAVRRADLIVTATTATAPYVHHEWLSPGVLVVNVSLDDLARDVFMRCDLLVVDDRTLVRSDRIRLLGRLIRAGDVIVDADSATAAASGPHARAVDAELGEILCGLARGRRRPNDIVVVNPFGLAIEDVALASAICQACRSAGAGVWLER